MRVKSPLRLAVSILILMMIIYVGYKGAVSIITGEPISFGFWSSLGTREVKNVENFVVAGIDEEGYRTDLILFCQYNLSDNSVNVLQIPRDTRVDTKRTDKKINSAYGSKGKLNAMYDEIESIVGIKPEKHIIISFKAFRELIDAIGGVTVNVPMRMYYTDPYQNLTIDLYPGEQLLDGRRAEMFMRFRMNNDGTGYKNGDIDRIAAQRSFYSAAMDKLLSGETILKAPKILSVVTKNVTTDFTGEEIIKYVGKIPKFSMEKVNIMSLPGEGGYDGGVSYFFHDKEKTEEIINRYFKSADAKKSELVSVNPARNKFIKVKVVDATGIDEKQADVLALVTEELKSHGFNVVSGEKADRIRDYSEMVNHNNKKAATEIGKLYENVRVLEEIQPYEKNDGEKSADVTLIIGNDFVF